MEEEYLHRIAVMVYQDNKKVELAIWITELLTTLKVTGARTRWLLISQEPSSLTPQKKNFVTVTCLE